MEIERRIRHERLKEYLKAEQAILSGQEYTISDRRLRRADLKHVQDMIARLLEEVSVKELRPGRLKRVVFQ